MNHNFINNPLKPNKCMNCGYPSEVHGDEAVCESCANKGNLTASMLKGKGAFLCTTCHAKELDILTREADEACKPVTNLPTDNPIPETKSEIIRNYAIANNLPIMEIKPSNEVTPEMWAKSEAYQSPELQEQRLEEGKLYTVIERAKHLDTSIRVASDLFNAKTISIMDLKQAIDTDESVTNKTFAFYQMLEEKIDYLQGVIFNLQSATVAANSTQRSIHDYLNNLRNKLTTEERAKTKAKDINYDTKMPKPVTPAKIKVNQQKSTDKQVREATAKLNIELGLKSDQCFGDYTIKMVMISKNWDLETTINHFRRIAKEGMSTIEPKGE